jgi:hypothetical protein
MAELHCHLRFVARFVPMRRTSWDTRPLVEFIATLRSFHFQPRPCGSPMVGTWPVRSKVHRSLFMRMWVTSLFSWSWPVVEIVSSGRLSLGRCLCMVRVVYASASAGIFRRRLVLLFLFVYLFIVCAPCIIFISLSLSMDFQILLVCFRACFARIIFLIVREIVLKSRECLKCLTL